MPKATRYPAIPGAQGPMPAIQPQQQPGDDGIADPTAGLQSLLAGQYTPPAPQTQPGGFPSSAMRNPAITGAISQKYGLGPDTGSTSQTDLESLDSFMRSGALSDKIAASVAPEQVKGQYGMAETGMKETGANTREEMKAQGAKDVEGMKASAALGMAGQKASGGTMDPKTVSYWADQVQRTPAMLNRIPAGNKKDVMDALASRGADLEDLTNQAKARAEAATTMLEPNPASGQSTFDEIRGMGSQLEQKGWFAPGTSLIRQTLASNGLGILTGDSQTAELFGKFQARLGLAISQLQNIHAGARGAASRDLRSAFEAMINAKGDPSTFRGQLDSAETLIRGYAAENAPVRGGVRVAPGGSIGSTPGNEYSNPNYQPR